MSVRFSLAGKPNRKGEYPIRVSIVVNGSRFQSSIGICIPKERWSQNAQEVIVPRRGDQIQKLKNINIKLHSIISQFESFETGISDKITADDIRDAFYKLDRIKECRAEKTDVLTYFDRFVREEKAACGWTTATAEGFKTFRQHLKVICRGKSLDFFNEDGLRKFMRYLRETRQMKEITVLKYYKELRWFLHWAIRKGYVTEDRLFRDAPKIKLITQPVIFLTREELNRLFKFEVPPDGTKVKLKNLDGREYAKEVRDSEAMGIARDLFCFCAFTSLRYSDMARVKRSDISGNILYTTTQKTNDRLPIDLNSFAKSILTKYSGFVFPDDHALPVMSNQKMNCLLKDLCELCKLTSPVTKTYVQGGVRKEETKMKWELIGTHCGRKTFICFALSSGIPPQIVMKWTGHSDYKAMKPYIDIAEKTKAEQMAVFEKHLKK